MKGASLGVTLIELMITVAILAIVAAVAIPTYTGYVQTSRQTEGWNNLQSLKLAEEEYFLENSTYTAVLGAAGLNWSPGETTPEFTYTVNDCADTSPTAAADDLSTCYKAWATGKGSKVPSSVKLYCTPGGCDSL